WSVTSGGHRHVLVTGASGLVGRQVVSRLLAEPGNETHVVALDLREPPAEERLSGAEYVTCDIRDPAIGKLMREHSIDAVVHLAAVVKPGPESSREIEYQIDVVGTRNVVDACQDSGVRQLVYTSSGAAYGYHADNPVPLSESDPLRANKDFAYAWHKRLAEELPFVLIWDDDVARCIAQGVRERWTGIYNLCGDGVLTLPEIARRLERPYLSLPPWMLAGTLRVLQAARLSKRGAEQVDFLRYRPVLCNDALKKSLGFTPTYTSEACFERYRQLRAGGETCS
ncbi:MAG: NAD-dependent epimerase/dehydratase family protein, partial [Myxococcota bacterium]